MAFDISTAKPIEAGVTTGFDISTARPIPEVLPQDSSIVNKVGRQAGLALRSVGPTAAGALAGAAIGAPIGGVGAIPGAIAGAGAMTLAQMVDNLAGTHGVDWVMDRLGLPKPETPTERVASDVMSGVSGQAGVVGVGTTLAKSAGPIVSRIGKVLEAAPGLQMTSAAAGSAAGGVTRESGGGPLAQLGANLGASIAVPIAAQTIKLSPLSEPIRNLLDESVRRDVPLTHGDITGRGKAMEIMLEQVPVAGIQKFRNIGAKKVTTAMEGFADEAKTAMKETNYDNLAGLEKSAASGDKSAKRILEQISNAGEDWTRVMQASGNLRVWGLRQRATELYDKVESLAAKRGQVPLTETRSSLDSAIAKETQSKLPDKALIKTLTELKDNLTEGNNFSAVRQLRSDLGDLVQNYYKGANAVIGAKGVGSMQSIRTAVERDMERFATRNGGELSDAWRQADRFYKLNVVPYKDKMIAKSLESDMPDEIYKNFIQVSRSTSGEDRAQKLYNVLGPKGRAAVRYGMISNALDAAVTTEGKGLSPGRFSQSLRNIRNSTKVFFNESDKKELDGFTNLMEHAARYGQYLENPPTGQRAIKWLAFGGSFIAPEAVAGVGATSYVVRKLVTTDTGKRFLLNASRLKVGSPEMEKLSEELAKQMPRILNQAELSNKENQSERRETSPQMGAGP